MRPSAVSRDPRLLVRSAVTLLAALAIGLSCEPGIVNAPSEAASVRIGPRGPQLEASDSTRLSAAALDASGNAVVAGRRAQWTSDAPQVARVDSLGWVRAMTPGLAVVRASVDGHSDTVTVTVLHPAVQALRLTSDTATVIMGQTRQLVAATYGRRDTLLTGRAVDWSSTATTIVTVATTGIVTARAIGTALVIARSEGKADTASIAVVPVPVKQLVVTPNPALVQLGGTLRLTADPRDSTGASLPGRAVTWTSGSDAVVTVDGDGLLRGVAINATTVTARSEGVATAVPVTVAVPAIALSRTTVPMTDRATGTNPPPQQVSITNGGPFTLDGLGSTITYGAGQPTGWLRADFNQATAPATLTLQATTGSLAPGAYTATVRVTSGVQGVTPADVAVTFTVTPQPQIALSSSAPSIGALAGGADPAPLDIAVTNAGTGTLSALERSVTYGPGASNWLDATLLATTAPTTLRLQPHVAGLAIGTYTATVTVSSTLGGVVPRAVTLTLVIAQGPTIGLSASAVSLGALAFSGTPATASVDVTNLGSGSLTGLGRTISANAPWLTATLGGTAPTTLSLSASAASLAAGTYTGTVTVTSTLANVAPRALDVTFTVGLQPVITVLPASASFDVTRGAPLPAAANLAVSNGGGGALTGLARTVSFGPGATGWLDATVGTTAPTTLSLQPTTTSLAAGTYTATVTLTSTVAGVASRDVPVALVVRQPQIGLAQATVALGSHTRGAPIASTSIAVTNAGEGALGGLSAQSNQAWVTPTITPSAPTTLSLAYNTSGLAAGTYNATVTVGSTVPGVTARTVGVSVTVLQPQIALSDAAPSRTVFIGDPGVAVAIAVTASGGGTLTGLATGAVVYGAGGSNWLASVALDATSSPTTLRLTINPAAIDTARSVTVTIPVSSTVPGVVTQNVVVTVQARWQFTRHIRPLLVAKCASCHSPRQLTDSVNLFAPTGLAAVGGCATAVPAWTRVVRGSLTQSLLYRKLADTPPPCGTSNMSGFGPTTNPWTANDTRKLREWILDNAP